MPALEARGRLCSPVPFPIPSEPHRQVAAEVVPPPAYTTPFQLPRFFRSEKRRQWEPGRGYGQVPTPSIVPYDIWSGTAPLLPARPSRAGGGRLTTDDCPTPCPTGSGAAPRGVPCPRSAAPSNEPVENFSDW